MRLSHSPIFDADGDIATPLPAWRVEHRFWARTSPSDVDPEGELSEADGVEAQAHQDATRLAATWASPEVLGLWSTREEALADARAQMRRELADARESRFREDRLHVDEEELTLHYVDAAGGTRWWWRARLVETQGWEA